MAKFIIEVSDDYIRERADIKEIIGKAEKDDKDVAGAMIELFTMTTMESRLNDGRNEFTISRDDMSDDKEREMFDTVFTRVAAMSIVADKNNENKEKKEE